MKHAEEKDLEDERIKMLTKGYIGVNNDVESGFVDSDYLDDEWE